MIYMPVSPAQLPVDALELIRGGAGLRKTIAMDAEDRANRTQNYVIPKIVPATLSPETRMNQTKEHECLGVIPPRARYQ
jgi:hypothetical protein